MNNSPEEQYKEGRLSGMFEAYDVIESAIDKLRNSIDIVWEIHDEGDSLDTSTEGYKDKLIFALHTLFVLRRTFQDEYDSRLDRIKSGMEGYRDEI